MVDYPFTEFVVFKVMAGFGGVSMIIIALLLFSCGILTLLFTKNLTEDVLGGSIAMMFISCPLFILGCYMTESCYNYKSRINVPEIRIPKIKIVK